MLPNHATQTDPYLHEPKGITTAANGTVYVANGAGSGTWSAQSSGASGSMVKSQASISTSSSTGTTITPFDNTIPQNTEGTQFISTSFTPTTSGNRLRIRVTIAGSLSVAGHITASLFQDANANASGASSVKINNAGDVAIIDFTYEYVTASTAASTWAVRVGGSVAGTFTLNGSAGLGLLGGVMCSSLVIEEIKA